MTQEEKQLFLADISARLPYGLMIKHPNVHCKLETYEYGRLDSVFIYADEIHLTLDTHDAGDFILNEKIKPYLRPMSSMTEKETNEYLSECDKDDLDVLSAPRYHGIDWLNKKMFDYRGLIPMGLAIEAPDDMYQTTQEK